MAFSGSATDPEDGAEQERGSPGGPISTTTRTTHPFQPETTGGSGAVTIQTRNETSDNVWYRFHLRATDSAGLSTEVTSDVLPRKVQVTLATQPAGLALTLDGQPVTAPTTFTGVVGLERDLGAADQQANGRSYRFDSWSDGEAASHTIATPASSTTYTATFTDIGPANQAPSVALSAAANGTVGSAMTLTATATDSDGSVTRVEFFDGTASLNVDTAAPFTFSWTPGTAGTHALTAVATDDQGATTRSAAVSVNVAAGGGADMQPPNIALTSPADLAQNLDGTLTLSATATDNVGVVGVEFQIDGQTVGSEVTSAPYSVTVDSTVHSSGQHIIRTRARDAAGNVSAWSRITVTFGSAQRLPAGFSKNESWVTGLSQPATFAQAPDGRIFVCEKGGRLRVIKNGALLPTPFHQFTVDNTGERGLIGLAFHPDFASNGYVYAHYTATTPTKHNRISRLVANGDVSTGAETAIVDLPTLSNALIHNGGAIHFGPDGKLYAAVGDNECGHQRAEPGRWSRQDAALQRRRHHPDRQPVLRLADRARAGGVGVRPSQSVHLRFPTRHRSHAHQRRRTEYAGRRSTVGVAGANYGWPGSEGPVRVTAGITAPLFTYSHYVANPPGSGPGGFLVGESIIGGAFYPANGNFPAGYRNSYFFADFVNRWVRRLDTVNEGDAYGFASIDDYPVSVLAGVDGALYVLKLGGSITRISAP